MAVTVPSSLSVGAGDAADFAAGELATEVLQLAVEHDLKIMVAESLTGGLLASTLVGIPGASKVFIGGIVAYSNEAKHVLLGVQTEALAEFGAVSPQIAGAMATGLGQGFASTAMFKVATTGVAGPDAQDGQPVGRVYVAVAGGNALKSRLSTKGWLFEGSRTEIRHMAVLAALEHLRDEILRHVG